MALSDGCADSATSIVAALCDSGCALAVDDADGTEHQTAQDAVGSSPHLLRHFLPSPKSLRATRSSIHLIGRARISLIPALPSSLRKRGGKRRRLPLQVAGKRKRSSVKTHPYS